MAGSIFWINIIYLTIAFVITHGEFIFGSSMDWGFQHITFPEYFRMLFYNTGDLFPDFAFNIGAGQNIYYFAALIFSLTVGDDEPSVAVADEMPFFAVFESLPFSSSSTTSSLAFEDDCTSAVATLAFRLFGL